MENKITSSRVFSSVDTAWANALMLLLERQVEADSRDGSVSAEIVGFETVIDASKQNLLITNTRRKMSHAYASAELLWYLSGQSNIGMISYYAPSYANYANVHGHAHGAYGPRVMPQMNKIIKTLDDDKTSRQAVISVWHPSDLNMISYTQDMPCTLSLQFIVRDHALHCITTMRSNDVWKGFPYDTFAFMCMQRIIAAHLDIDIGLYFHRVGSLHLYTRNLKAAIESLEGAGTGDTPMGWRLDDTLTTCDIAVAAEQDVRLKNYVPCNVDALGDMMQWCVKQCSQFISKKRGSDADLCRCRSCRQNNNN